MTNLSHKSADQQTTTTKKVKMTTHEYKKATC